MAGRILIADNVATNRIVLKVNLSAASYMVSQATNGPEMLQQAQDLAPDLILMDGGLDGDRALDCLQDLKDAPATADIPVLILTSEFTAAERYCALMAGATDILAKPVTEADLLAAIRGAQRGHSVEKELQLREDTAMELGFRETACGFENPASLLLINTDKTASEEWLKYLRETLPLNAHLVAGSEVLEFLAKKPIQPDIVVLFPTQEPRKGELFLLAELRNRAATRNAEILVVRPTDTGRDVATPSALDLGASEVVGATVPAGEMAFRIKRLLARKQKADTLRGTVEQGLRMAVTDPLTGLFNRRYALPHMARIAEKSKANGNPFAVMVLDLDHFKQINDTHGHRAGDMVLIEVARRLKANVRNVDLIARIGGEEFLVVMPETDMASASQAAERLRHVTEAEPIIVDGAAAGIHVTTSIGVSIAGKTDAALLSIEAMVDRADQALLGAKSTGRNQVTIRKNAA